jgi:hypothetical protein
MGDFQEGQDGFSLDPSHTTMDRSTPRLFRLVCGYREPRREALLKELTVAGSVERSLPNMWASNIRRLLIGSKSGSGDEGRGWELPIRA